MPASFFNRDRMAGEPVDITLSDGRTVQGFATYTVAVEPVEQTMKVFLSHCLLQKKKIDYVTLRKRLVETIG